MEGEIKNNKFGMFSGIKRAIESDDLNPELNKWEVYRNKLVSAVYQGTGYIGIVKSISPEHNCVYLQPCAVGDPSGEKLERNNELPIMVPFEGTIPVPLLRELDEFILEWNKNKAKKNQKIDCNLTQ